MKRIRTMSSIALLMLVVFTGSAPIAEAQRERGIRDARPGDLHGNFGGAFQSVKDAERPEILHVRAYTTGFAFGNSTMALAFAVDTSATPNAIPAGHFVLTTVKGDTITGRFRGVATVPGENGFVNMAARYEITGGTGRFENAEGFGILLGVFKAGEGTGGVVNLDFTMSIRLAQRLNP